MGSQKSIGCVWSHLPFERWNLIARLDTEKNAMIMIKPHHIPVHMICDSWWCWHSCVYWMDPIEPKPIPHCRPHKSHLTSRSQHQHQRLCKRLQDRCTWEDFIRIRQDKHIPTYLDQIWKNSILPRVACTMSYEHVSIYIIHLLQKQEEFSP